MEDASIRLFIKSIELGSFYAKYSFEWKTYSNEARTSLRIINRRIESNEIIRGKRSSRRKIKTFNKRRLRKMGHKDSWRLQLVSSNDKECGLCQLWFYSY